MNNSLIPLPVPGRAGTVDLVAGVLCLDFVNTVDPRVVTDDGTWPRNYLTSYEELILWGQHVDILSVLQAQGLLKEAQRHSENAQTVLDQAITLREIIYEIFVAMAQQRDVPSEALNRLHNFYSRAIQQATLSPIEEGFGLIWQEDSRDLMLPLWPVAASAMELLLRGEKQRMKECPSQGEGCGWLFYDTSKNNSRRWCSMRTCGMQSKDRRRGKRQRPSASSHQD